jgi:hypothetical protein
VIRTKYSSFNFGLILLGVLVALADAWLAAMTSAFGADPVHDMKTGAIMLMLVASMVLIPASLITMRWPTIGAAMSSVIAVLCAACILLSPVAILFLILAAVEAVIANTVKNRSEEPSGGLTIRPS